MKRLILPAMLLWVVFAVAGEEVTHIGDPRRRVVLERVEFREDPYEPGAYLDAGGYRPYEGGYLPKDLAGRSMYTFRGRFSVASDAREHTLAVYLGPKNYPFHLYLNGVLLSAGGRHPREVYTGASFVSRSVLLPPQLIRDGTNVLSLQVYPVFEDSPPGPLAISTYANVAGWVFWRNFVGVYAIRGATILALVLSIYFLILFVSRLAAGGGASRRFLYFFFVCVGFIMAYFEIIFQYDSTREVLIKGIAKTGFVWTVAAVTLFVFELTGTFARNRAAVIATVAPAAVFSLILLTRGSKEAIEGAFGVVMMYVFGPALLFNIGVLLVAYLRRRKTQTLAILLAFLAVLAGSLHDIYYVSVSVLPYAYFTAYGFIVMVVAMFLVLAWDQTRLYREALAREAALAEQNGENERLLEGIRRVAESLMDSSRRLDEGMQESTALLESNEDSRLEMSGTIAAHVRTVEDTLNRLQERVASQSERIAAAVAGQTRFVEEVSATLRDMNEHIDLLASEAGSSSRLAGNLASIAEGSSEVIDRADTAVQSVGDYSRFIEDVLQAVEDIAERTNLLSINAAIEAARAGSAGQGFSVVAGEVRSLSSASKSQLEASFQKIGDMRTAIQQSTELSRLVAGSLHQIIEESRKSADRIAAMNERLGNHREESNQMLKAVEQLHRDTITIRDLSESSAAQDRELTETLRELKSTFRSVEELLTDQRREAATLTKMMDGISHVLTENRKNVEILGSSAIDGAPSTDRAVPR